MADVQEEEVEGQYIKNPPELDGVADLSLLVHLEMENVLDNLEYRWFTMKPKEMYTSISTILIAINPYERDPSKISADVIKHYHEQALAGAFNMKPPHPYAAGARSYLRMISRGKHQSVIVCGESGAGKTETTKLVIRYLAETNPGSNDGGSIEMQILAASPVLESFGNAKTVLNNNSSRFGKFTKLLYSVGGGDDVVSGAIVGATLETYLLEKSRVIYQAPKERNYHAFYFIHAGLNGDLRAEYGLSDDLMDYQYTSRGGTTEVPGINDKAAFDELATALSAYRLDENDRNNLYKAVMGIMHLGNVNLIKDDQDNAICDPESGHHIDHASALLGITRDALENRLQTNNVKFGKKTIAKKIQFQDGEANRDAVSKGLYNRIFLYLALRINQDLSQIDESSAENYLFVGILDVFGFENFKKNSLEQFCINFTNEKLQNYFNKNIIESEQEEYIRESVTWTPMEVPNCQPMIDLVEDSKIGMFAILDAASQTGTVEFFNDELFKKQKDCPLVKKPKLKRSKKKTAKRFAGTFKHYADTVTYEFTLFLEKNKEKVSLDTKKVLKKSTNPLVADVMGVKTKKKKGFQSVTNVFSKALKRLMKNLDLTEPYFIRCVNPNKQKSAKVFVRQVVKDQLRCGGIIEALRVLKLGYPTRVEYNLLYARYNGKIDNPLVNRLPPNKFSAAVLIAFGVNTEEYELGLTKIFFKPAKAQILEEIMNQEEPLTEEQNQRIIDWLARSRVKQLIGSIKVYSYYAMQVRNARALERWEKVGRTIGAISQGLIAHVRHAREVLDHRKKTEAADSIRAYWMAFKDKQAMKKKLKKRRVACKKIWKAYTKYIQREAFMKALTDSIDKTRADLAEQERRRIEHEKAMAAEQEAEAKKLLEVANAKKELLAYLKRQMADSTSDIIKENPDEDAVIAAMGKRLDEIASRYVSKNCAELLPDGPPAEIVDEVKSECDPKYRDAYNAEQARLKAEEAERIRKQEEAEAETAKKKVLLAVNAEKVRQNTMRLDVEKRKTMQLARKERLKKKKEKAQDTIDAQHDNDYIVKSQKGQQKLNEILHGEAEEDEAEEGEVVEEQGSTQDDNEPFKFDKETFHRTASNGTLFRKHKYRKRNVNDARYTPKEVFIKVNFDAESGQPLRITWGTGNRHVEWEHVKLIAWGLHTPTFTAMSQNSGINPQTCFSVVSTHTILDVQNEDPKMVQMWVTGLRQLLGQTDEEADKLSTELRLHPPTTKPRSKGNRERKQKEQQQKSQGDGKERKNRTESLILLQKDLFILTTTTVFRTLEEEYYNVTQEVKNHFDSNVMYEAALGEDISWRKWQPWLREKVLVYMREKGLLGTQGSGETSGGEGSKEGSTAQGSSGSGAPAKQDDKDCCIS